MLDENKDFDLLMRSMLEDAEARPPRGAWKAISSRLDEPVRTRQAVAGPWFRWAGATLAFAAALGLGLFFTGTNRSEPLQPERGIALLSGVKPEIITDFDNAAPLKSYAARLTASAETAPQVAEAADGANIHAENVDNGSSPAAKPAGKSRKWKKMEPSQDDFDLLAMNESGSGPRARRLSLYTKGSIGGNDSDFKFKSPAVAMAPGAKESGITELSTSTYGIPLTLGLGVRYYVLPRLSVGSGIDYSLLTRTFTGKYTGTSSVTGEEIQEAGNVSHSLHYIGIPLGLYYDMLSTDKLKLYIYGLGEAEYCIASKYTLFASPNITRNEHVEKLQYSVGGGLGIEFKLSRILGLYIDPSIRYYFPSDQPKSIRTDKPVMVSFDAGLRFNF